MKIIQWETLEGYTIKGTRREFSILINSLRELLQDDETDELNYDNIFLKVELE
ncbi:MAG: hypothetical protein WC516_08160 [Patescibacteria group bacterium]|jgi:hypothetical protein